MAEFTDDADLEKLYEHRMKELKQAMEEKQRLKTRGHGQLTEIEEKEFLETVTQTSKVVVHFFHRDFERCKIADKHLATLAQKYFKTRFVKISAPDAPFFVEKLQVQILPCIILFRNGVAVDRIVGFDELGAKDDFRTATMEATLLKAEVIDTAHGDGDDSDEDEAEQRTSIRKGGDYKAALKVNTGVARLPGETDSEDDESSDFD
jgi:thioredoxin-like negative regulator of GroEL